MVRDSLWQCGLYGHTQRVLKVLILNPDTVITSSRDLTVVVWNIQTAERQHVLMGHAEAARDLIHYQNLLFAGGDDGAVRVWDLDTGHCVHVLEGRDNRPVGRLSLNQDATLLATAI
jgi:F-box and WD-40 domain protein CDC4